MTKALRVSLLAGPLAALTLLGTSGFQPRRAAAASLTHVVAQLGSDCLEGYNWPGDASVDVKLKDGGGNVVYTTTATTAPSGHFVVNLEANRVFCDIPVTLRPGMTYTASDGSTTKTLVIEHVSFDLLDPDRDTAAGTNTSPRPVQVSVYWDADARNVYVTDVPRAGDHWSLDVGSRGGKVESDSQGDAFVPDDSADGHPDFTKATIFVTAVSLNASVPAGGASRAIAQAAGARVRRGNRVRLSGRLSANSAGALACVRRKRVRLVKLVGRRSRTLASARTTKSGRYSFVRKVKRTTRFQVRYRGNRTCQRSRSHVRTIHVAGA